MFIRGWGRIERIVWQAARIVRACFFEFQGWNRLEKRKRENTGGLCEDRMELCENKTELRGNKPKKREDPGTK